MVVAACVDVLEPTGFGIMPFGVDALEQEAFDFVGGVQRVVILLILILGELLEHTADVGRVRAAVLIDDFAEYHHFAGAEEVRRRPVEGGPVEAQPQIALLLRRKAANRGSVLTLASTASTLSSAGLIPLNDK